MERIEGNDSMRIEGTYTFPGAIERVFTTLTNAEQLRGILPGCERVIQLGPTGLDGAVSFEARIQSAPDGKPVTMTATAVAARRPAHLRLELHGRTPRGRITGTGLIDLVAQEDFTLLAYVWNLDMDSISSAQQHAARDAAWEYIRASCERLTGALRVEAASISRASPLPTGNAMDEGEVMTPRGKIVRLRAMPQATAAGAWIQRAAWMTTGIFIGISAIGLLMGLARWFSDRER